MFQDKKLRVTFIVEIVLPYLIFVFGIPAINCYANHSWDIVEICYPIAIGTGLVVLFAELAIGIVGIAELVRNLITRNKDKYCILGNVVIGFCSVFLWLRHYFYVVCCVIDLWSERLKDYLRKKPLSVLESWIIVT